jgi:hypothetical protein
MMKNSNQCIYNFATRTMVNQCSDLKYLNEILHTNSAMAFGHGCDIEYKELTVPTGCEYYTGITAAVSELKKRK